MARINFVSAVSAQADPEKINGLLYRVTSTLQGRRIIRETIEDRTPTDGFISFHSSHHLLHFALTGNATDVYHCKAYDAKMAEPLELHCRDAPSVFSTPPRVDQSLDSSVTGHLVPSLIFPPIFQTLPNRVLVADT